jgi:hypothetical protein
MSKQKKPSPERMNAAQPPKRQAAARSAGSPKKFSDVPMVQKPLFDLDQGGAR